MTLYRKYRPQLFADLVGQDHIRDTILQAVKDDKLSHAYLFTGPRGTGKTTTARLISKVANCTTIEKERAAGKKISGEPCGKCDNCLEIMQGKSLDIIEIDAASNRGIDDIRSLREQVRFAPAKSKYKVYIIDEVHMLTKEAFNALLKTLEEPPAHAIFILATTEPYKVLPTIISRTQRFDFKRITASGLVSNLTKVAEAENLKSEPEALEMLAVLADGGGRDSLSLLEQIAAYSSDITAENVRSILGIVELSQVINLIRAIFNSDAEEGLKIAHSLYEQGMNLSQLNASIVDVLRKLLTYTIAGTFFAAETEENKKRIIDAHKELEKSAGAAPAGRLLAIIKNFIDAGKMMKDTVDPLVAIEVAIVESVDSTKLKVNAEKDQSQMSNHKSQIKSDDVKSELEASNSKGSKSTHSTSSGQAPGHGSNTVEETATIKQDINLPSSVIARRETTKQSEDIKEEDPTTKTSPSAQATDNRQEDEALKPQDSNTKDSEDNDDSANDSNNTTIKQSSNSPLNDLPEDVWTNIISEVKKENNPLAALLRDAKPMAVETGKLVLGVRFKFHKDKISEVKNIQILEGVICNVTGNSCRVQCEIADFSAGKKKESHSPEELASEAERVFME